MGLSLEGWLSFFQLEGAASCMGSSLELHNRSLYLILVHPLTKPLQFPSIAEIKTGGGGREERKEKKTPGVDCPARSLAGRIFTNFFVHSLSLF